jgi:uncharacterized membrane protein
METRMTPATSIGTATLMAGIDDPAPEPGNDPAGAQPTEPASPPSRASYHLNTLRWSDPLRWLMLGWRDYLRHPGIGTFYGLCFVAMGWALMTVFEHAPAWTLALSGGFLLVGPFMCMGMYQVSQRLERGEGPDLGDSLTAWDEHIGQMAIFGFVLLVLEMVWARSTLVIFALSFDGMPDFKGSLMALFNPENIEFIVAWLAVGSAFAAMIFSVSVVSIPMMLDEQVDAITAGLTSLRLVLTQTGVMLFWGALITGLVALAMLPWFAGLLVVGPVLGHASWHAYRAAVKRVD